jgi:8-oxo-dGTP diphosphatase
MYSYKYPRPALTVDALVYSKLNDVYHVLLVQRGIEPFKGNGHCPGVLLIWTSCWKWHAGAS